jgi:hypothetical protein
VIAGASSLSEPSLHIWQFSLDGCTQVLLDDLQENFACMGNQGDGAVVCSVLGVSFLWYWYKN